MEWFENILQLCESYVLENKEFLDMADEIEI